MVAYLDSTVDKVGSDYQIDVVEVTTDDGEALDEQTYLLRIRGRNGIGGSGVGLHVGPGDDEELLDGRNEFVRKAFDVGTQVVFDVPRGGNVLAGIVQVQVQLATPNAHEAGYELPEEGFLVLWGERENNGMGISICVWHVTVVGGG